MIEDEISFRAELVAGDEEEFSPDFFVHGIYFGEGDPENGGEHWNFTRAFGDNDDDEAGVCTVKEIQQATVYGGIARFLLGRRSLRCEFDEETAKETGVRTLRIDYAIDDATWDSLLEHARKVFEGEPYFAVSD
jgi:Immunity protein 10